MRERVAQTVTDKKKKMREGARGRVCVGGAAGGGRGDGESAKALAVVSASGSERGRRAGATSLSPRWGFGNEVLGSVGSLWSPTAKSLNAPPGLALPSSRHKLKRLSRRAQRRRRVASMRDENTDGARVATEDFRDDFAASSFHLKHFFVKGGFYVFAKFVIFEKIGYNIIDVVSERKCNSFPVLFKKWNHRF
jgi:hypothetical protein